MRSLVVFAVLLGGVMLIAARPAEAGFIKRDFLIKSCASSDEQRLADCTGYLIGVTDTTQSEAGSKVCVPAGLAIRNLRDAVVYYLRAHAKGEPDGDAAPAVRAALRALYPCPQ